MRLVEFPIIMKDLISTATYTRYDAFVNIDDISCFRAQEGHEKYQTVLYTISGKTICIDLKIDEVVKRINEANTDFSLHEIHSL